MKQGSFLDNVKETYMSFTGREKSQNMDSEVAGEEIIPQARLRMQQADFDDTGEQTYE
jgi:hypothetical protein